MQSRVVARSKASALRPLASRDCGFESRRRHGCLSVVSVVCCQVGVLARDTSLIQKIPTEYGVSECVRGTSYRWPEPKRAPESWEKNYIAHVPLEYFFGKHIEVYYLILKGNCHAIVKSTITHAAETWCLRAKMVAKLNSTETDFRRRSARISRKDKIRNTIIKQKMKVLRSLLDDIKTK